MTKTARIAITFIALGAKTNPIPMGQSALTMSGWKLAVLSSTPNATAQVLATTNPYGEHLNPTPPPGAQDFMISLSATYVAGGSSQAYSLVNFLKVVGSHGVRYDSQSNYCGSWLPTPSLKEAGEIFSGINATGNVCWQIASNDAASLQLVTSTYTPATGSTDLYFALH